jgi:hypothetical protein
MEKIQTEPDHAQHPAQASDTTLETHDNGVDTLSTTAEKPVPTADDANAAPANDALTKTPSQAEQLGKSKVILVMGALCVCI